MAYLFFSWTEVYCVCEENLNKKVLLRERKRHTARHVASAHYAALSHRWGGYPGYPPYPNLRWVTPPSRPGQGGPQVPPPSKPEMGYPPPSRPGQGVPQVSPLPRPEMGYPPVVGMQRTKSLVFG